MDVRCNCCNTPLSDVVELGHYPLCYGLSDPKIESILSKKRFPARLAVCEKCQLVQQPYDKEIFDSVEHIYDHYGVHTINQFSDTGWGQRRFQVFQRNFQLKRIPEKVLEIGCGNGFLLEELIKRGAKLAVGFEPSFSGASTTVRKAIIYPEFFNEHTTEKIRDRFDVIYSNAVLEHIADLPSHFSTIRRLLRPRGSFLCGVPNGEFSMQHGDFGLFAHEHVNYFTVQSIENCLAYNGLKLRIITQEPEIIYFEAVPDRDITVREGIGPKTDTACDLDGFIRRQKDVLSSLKNRIQQSARKIGFYGAFLGLSNLLAHLDLQMEQYHVFDSDRNKWDRKMAGIPTAVEKLDAICRPDIDIIVVVPLVYQEEIEGYLREMNLGDKTFRLYS